MSSDSPTAAQQQLQQARRGGSGPLDHYPCDGPSLARTGSLTPSGAFESTQKQQARRGGSGPLDHYPCDGGPSLARTGSLTPSGAHTPSACLTPTVPQSPFGDSSRQHRVERQRKMAEAKGRTGGAAGAGLASPDVASLKRKCETLETENRSLKTFQSFMNRKDSEQTTRIEQLEQENAQLRAENERLREELAAARQTGMAIPSMPTMHAAGMAQP
ncbi:unnamed protein product [Closterium sp. NIES-65]|nr:unnamed protein product [Closterium sp. NIES-65]